jgi:hypothetical protein
VETTKTIGMEDVVCLQARAAVVAPATITLGLWRTKSSANSAKRPGQDQKITWLKSSYASQFVVVGVRNVRAYWNMRPSR